MAVAKVAIVAPAGEVWTKSRRSQRTFRRALRRNLRAALDVNGVHAWIADHAGRIGVHGDAAAAAKVAAEVFGVSRVQVAEPLGDTTLEGLSRAAAARAADRVRNRTFAARVRRRGRQPWSSMDAERQIGALLAPRAAGVDLEQPDVEVRVLAYDDDAFLVDAVLDGPGGLPLGTQDRALALVSGGFDSAVAAWRIMRRGVPLDFLHIELACAQTDNALVVARELWRRWAPGTDPVGWVVNFDAVRTRLLEAVDPRVRQVRLKELMMLAADAVAERAGVEALVTGDAIGQVSTQTVRHLAVIDRSSTRPVLRPLAGADKEEIITSARQIGTHDYSLRSREVCDLSDGPVVTRAGDPLLEPARCAAPADLALRAAEGTWRLPLREWAPGMPAPWAA